MFARWRLPLSLAILCAGGYAQADGVEEARLNLKTLTARQDALAALVGANRSELSRLLGALLLFGRDPPPALLVSPADARDAVRGAILARAMAPVLEGRARGLAAQAANLSDLRKRVAAAEGDLFAAESAMQDSAGAPQPDDAAGLVPPGARASGSNVSAGAAPGGFLQPVRGVVVGHFGALSANGQRARGLTLDATAGAVVQSPADVVVEFAGPLQGWGEVVILAASGGYHMVLSGFGRVLVVPGQQVAAGQTLGLLPSVAAPPPRLYFEVRRGDAPVDPTPLMNRANASGLRRKLL